MQRDYDNLNYEYAQYKAESKRELVNTQLQQEGHVAVLLRVADEDTSPGSSMGGSFPSPAAPPGNYYWQLMPACTVRQSHRGHHQSLALIEPPSSALPQMMSAVTSATTSTTTTKSRHNDLDAYQYGPQNKQLDKFKPTKGPFLRMFSRHHNRILTSATNSGSSNDKGEVAADAKKVQVKGNKLVIQTVKD